MDAVFKCLAAPVRREILALLGREGGLSAGEIARRFPALPRPGISRDLRMLRSARLVSGVQLGRRRVYQLRPEPLKKIQDEWFAQFSKYWDTKLQNLQSYAERIGHEQGAGSTDQENSGAGDQDR